MAETAQLTMKCSACNLRYPWSPQTAGKKVKCKCGTIFVAPLSLDRPATPRVDAAVAKIAAARPTSQNVSAVAKGRPASPKSPPPSGSPLPSIIDLEDESEDLYDIADDLVAPPSPTPRPPPSRHPRRPPAAATVARCPPMRVIGPSTSTTQSRRRPRSSGC